MPVPAVARAADPAAARPAATPGDELPVIIQGGMGVAVSGWALARAVASAGQLGVVSGVALDLVLARRLQLGDPGGAGRRALAALPLPGAAGRILRRYYVPGGIGEGQPFRPVPRIGLRGSAAGRELAVAGNFTEVYLAKEGHNGLVGINYLEKLQLATPAAVYGAMLAGVDYVLMGAGIPAQIPRLLDALAAGRLGELDVTVAGADPGTRHVAWLDPAELSPAGPPPLRPGLPGHRVLRRARRLPGPQPGDRAGRLCDRGARRRRPQRAAPGPAGAVRPRRACLRPTGRRSPGETEGAGQAVLAGGRPGGGRAAGRRGAAGAAGIQVGTAFALCRESGMDPGCALG